MTYKKNFKTKNKNYKTRTPEKCNIVLNNITANLQHNKMKREKKIIMIRKLPSLGREKGKKNWYKPTEKNETEKKKKREDQYYIGCVK